MSCLGQEDNSMTILLVTQVSTDFHSKFNKLYLSTQRKSCWKQEEDEEYLKELFKSVSVRKTSLEICPGTFTEDSL